MSVFWLLAASVLGSLAVVGSSTDRGMAEELPVVESTHLPRSSYPPRLRTPGRAFAEFDGWVSNYIACRVGEITPSLLERGETAAIARRSAMRKLIRTDPEQALQRAIDAKDRLRLPDRVRQHLEKWVSGEGDFLVMAVDFENGTHEVRREIVHGNNRYEAFVFGRRLLQGTTMSMPFYGVAIGDMLAIDEKPVRVVQPGEKKKPAAPEPRCPVCGLQVDMEAAPVLGQIGGRIEAYCSEDHLQQHNEALLESSSRTAGAWEGRVPAQGQWTKGCKTLLFMPVCFPDDPSEPIATSEAYQLMNEANKWFVDASYNTTCLIPTVTPLLMLPYPKAHYTALGSSELARDARKVARAAGYESDNYDLDIVRHASIPGLTYSGLAIVGGRGALLTTSRLGIVLHELGHNYGLGHARFWQAEEDSVIGPGTHVEYGDSFDSMGSAAGGRAVFNGAFRYRLGWLPDSVVHEIRYSGLYRIHALDVDGLVPNRFYAIRVNKDVDREYWGELRHRYADNPWMINGVMLRWASPNATSTDLLDTTPLTPAGKDDCALVVGRTFSDPGAGVHITPLEAGGTGEDRWLDIVVNLGQFPDNHAPQVAVAASATQVPIGTQVTLVASARDSDLDQLAYFWDFGDDTLAPNSSVVRKRWDRQGEFVVRCTVSDMKGGFACAGTLVTVGEPDSLRISGRVTTPDASPVDGALVYCALNRTFTDGNGEYQLTGLPPSSTVTLAASKYGYLLAPVGTWSNPIKLTSTIAGIDFAAIARPMVSVDSVHARIAEGSRGTVVVRRQGADQNPLTVKVTMSGSATPGSDFTLRPEDVLPHKEVQLPSGVRQVEIEVEALDDNLVEGPEQLTFTLAADSAYTLGPPAQTTLLIVDNEPPNLPKVSVFSRQDSLAPESGPGAAAFLLERTGNPGGELIVRYTCAGEAVPNLDYVNLPGTVVFPDGCSSARVIVQAVQDVEVEGPETVTLTILEDVSYSIGTASASITIADDDPTVVMVTPTEDRASEPKTEGTVTFTRYGRLDTNLRVEYSLAGTAKPGIDYLALPGFVIIAAGQTSATVKVTPLDDTVLEGDETTVFQVLSTPAYNVGVSGTATMIVCDDELPQVTLTVSCANAYEADTQAGSFTFTRTGNLDEPLTVHFRIAGSASNSIDCKTLSQPLLIEAGSAYAVLQVFPNDDPYAEVDETVAVTLMPDPAYNVGQPATGSVVIVDNDQAQLPLVEFAVSESACSEESGPVGITVVLSRKSSEVVSVDYAVVGGTATGLGVDYLLDSGRIEFSPGETTAAIPLFIVQDTLSELTETLIVELANPKNALLGPLSTFKATLIDDDGQVVSVTPWQSEATEEGSAIGIVRIGRSSSMVDEQPVRIQLTGTASLGADYVIVPAQVVIPSGQSFVDLSILPVEDSTEESEESVVVTLIEAPGASIGSPSVAVVKIIDNDGNQSTPIVNITAPTPTASESGQDLALFEIHRTTLSLQPLIVHFTVGGTATSGTDFEPLPISAVIPGDAAETILAVRALDDAETEGPETVVITLTEQQDYRVGTSAVATATILDSRPSVSMAAVGSSAENGSSSGYFVISRTGNAEHPLSLSFVVTGTATVGQDFVPLQESITLPSGVVVTNISLVALDDGIPEGTETVVVTLLEGAGYSLSDPASASVLILDDEPVLTVTAPVPIIAENGPELAEFLISRSGSTNSPLHILYMLGGTAQAGDDFLLLADNLLIPAGAHSARALLKPIDDDLQEGDEDIAFQLLPSDAYAVEHPVRASIVVRDDDLNFPPTATISSPIPHPVYLPNTNNLLVIEALVTDDGLPSPPGAVNVRWDVESGPAPVEFGDAESPITTAQFSVAGMYVLRLTATDGALTSRATVTVVAGTEHDALGHPRALWHCDETSGTVAFDSSGHACHASLDGPVFLPGKIANALTFDGFNDVASFSATTMRETTLAAWLYLDGEPGSPQPESKSSILIALPGCTLSVNRQQLGLTQQLGLVFEVERALGTARWQTPLGALLPASWTHVAATYTLSGLGGQTDQRDGVPSLYINGRPVLLIGSGWTDGEDLGGDGPGYLGNSASRDQPLRGQLDEIQVYDRILTEREIQVLAASGSENTSLWVDAGEDQVADLADPLVLEGRVIDPGTGTSVSDGFEASWSKYEGPGDVAFGDPSRLETTAFFQEAGMYVLQLAVSNGKVKVIDRITVDMNGLPKVYIQPNQASAAELSAVKGQFTLVRTGPVREALEVQVSLSGTALSGLDFVGIPTTAVFAVGSNCTDVDVCPIPDDLPEGDETVLISLQPGKGYSLAAPTSATLLIRDLPFDAWRFQHFSPEELAFNMGLEETDPDADGKPNLLEYALNLDPQKAESDTGFAAAIEPVPPDQAPALVITFQRRRPPTDVTYEILLSPDLRTWSNDPNLVRQIGPPDVHPDGITEAVRLQILGTIDQPHMFIRLKISRTR